MRTLEKSVQILRLVAMRNGIGARDIGESLGFSKSATHRLLSDLQEVGLIQRVKSGEGFAPGPLLGELVGGQFAEQRLIRLARPHMARLRDLCGETIGLHVIQGERRVLLEQVESRNEHRWVYSNPGVPMPLHAGAASKMLLAMLPPERALAMLKRRALVAFTRETPRDASRLVRELARINAQGFAISSQEVTRGIASIAVPVATDVAPAAVTAAMSITGPSIRLSERVLKGFLPQLRHAAGFGFDSPGEGPTERRVVGARAG
jgi:IclR family acetate operon transcriptional repressor